MLTLPPSRQRPSALRNTFLQPLPARLNIDEIAVADSLTQLQGTFTDWSQFNATASRERRKQVMLQQQWEKLIRNYTSLPTGEQYQLTLAAYDDACGAYNQLLFVIDSRTLAIVQAEQNIQALNEQLPRLRNSLDQLMAQDEPWVAQFLYRAYEMAKSAILRNLFQQVAASNFIHGTANRFTIHDTSHTGLLAKSAELQEGIFRQLQSMNPSAPTTFVRILLNNSTLPGFEAGLSRNRIDFQARTLRICCSGAGLQSVLCASRFGLPALEQAVARSCDCTFPPQYDCRSISLTSRARARRTPCSCRRASPLSTRGPPSLCGSSGSTSLAPLPGLM